MWILRPVICVRTQADQVGPAEPPRIKPYEEC
jgi:hypothetical protein